MSVEVEAEVAELRARVARLEESLSIAIARLELLQRRIAPVDPTTAPDRKPIGRMRRSSPPVRVGRPPPPPSTETPREATSVGDAGRYRLISERPLRRG